MARLPQPGGDAGNWGEILNEFLTQSIASDGSIKTNSVGASQLKSKSVTADKLSTNTATTGQLLAYDAGDLKWVSPSTGGAISSNDITDASIIGKSILTTPDAATARTTIGAGTSSLTLGTTNSTAKAGDYQPTADQVTETSTNKVLTATERTKLSGIATSATANATDVQLRDRSTHTGTQTVGTITGLSTVATSGSYTDLSNKPTIPTVPVTSVASRTGDITLAKADVGLGNVDNTSDANKPVSTAAQSALDAKAADTAVVKLTGDQTIAGVKTFSSSPILPAPTTAFQPATKAYADDSKVDIYNKLAAFFAAAVGLRDTQPVIVAIAGASVAAQITSDRWTYQFNARLQATYPRPSASEQPIITLSTANGTPPTGTGMVTVNAAIGGSVTSNYLTSTTRPQLMNLHPAVIIHADMPANDYGSKAVTPAQVKTNMITQLNALDALGSSNYPYIHVVVGGYFPTITGAVAPISEFRQAMREATEGRSNVLFIDTYDFFTSIGVGSGGSDPLDLLLADNLHPNARGHKVLADYVSRLFNLSPISTVSTGAPAFVTTSLGTVTQNSAYSLTISASGTAPITWSVVAGSLPTGLTIGSSTGTISGTPSATGAYSFTLRATNSVSSTDRAFSGTVDAAVNPVATILRSDNFTTDGAISGRTANAALGGTTATWVASGAIYTTSGGSLTHSGSTSGAIQLPVADNQDAQVSATLTSFTSGPNTNIEIYRKSSGTCYLLGVSASGSTIRLGKSDGTIFQDYGITPASIIGKKLTLRYYSGKVSAYLDDVLMSEHADTTVTRTGSGIGFSRGSGTITATWDNFIVETLV